MSNPILFGAALVVMLIGLMLTVVTLPGMTVIWLAALVYGLIEGFGSLGAWLLAALGVLMLGSYALSFWLRHAGAVHTGASWKGIALGCVFGLVGAILIPIIGLPIGVALGVYTVEYARQRDAQAAWRATRGALFGFGAGIIQELAVSLFMIGLWLLWVFAG